MLIAFALISSSGAFAQTLLPNGARIDFSPQGKEDLNLCIERVSKVAREKLVRLQDPGAQILQIQNSRIVAVGQPLWSKEQGAQPAMLNRNLVSFSKVLVQDSRGKNSVFEIQIPLTVSQVDLESQYKKAKFNQTLTIDFANVALADELHKIVISQNGQTLHHLQEPVARAVAGEKEALPQLMNIIAPVEFAGYSCLTSTVADHSKSSKGKLNSNSGLIQSNASTARLPH